MEAEIRSLLQENGIAFDDRNRKSFICRCPRCAKAEKMYIRRRDGRFICWYCGESEGFQGRCEYGLQELLGLPLAEIKQRLYGGRDPQGMDLALDFGQEEEDFLDLGPQIFPRAWPPDYLPLNVPAATPGRQYLESRGLDIGIYGLWDIRYSPRKRRVAFPVHSGNTLVGWQERLIDNDKPYWDASQQKIRQPLKSISSPGLPRDLLLMFSPNLYRGQNHVILCEGPVDALRCQRLGGAVASMGKIVSPTQLALIRNSGAQNLYLGLDPDAWLEINSIRGRMTDMKIFDFRAPSPYKDLGEMSEAEVHKLFAQAPVLEPTAVVLYVKNYFGA